jgi:hypothetical protein
LIETVLLAAIGTTVGAVLAQALSQFLVKSIGTRSNIVFLDVTPDFRVLGFAAAVAALTCIFFGLTPALRATQISPGAAMKVAGRGLTAGRERFSLRRGLVVVQVALSLVLVAGALLFSRSFSKLLNFDAGFNQENLLITTIGFNRLKIEPLRRLEFRDQLLDRVKNVPGVDDVSEMDTIPLSGGGRGSNVWLEGRSPDDRIGCSFNRIGVDYLKTLQIPLVAVDRLVRTIRLMRLKSPSSMKHSLECCAKRILWVSGW